MEPDKELPPALALLSSERPRNLGWLGAGGLLFGDWGTSRLYVLGLAFVVAGRSSFFLISAMSLLILAVGWAYTQICRIYPDGGGVYTAARAKLPILGVVGALLLFADYTVTASLSSVEAFHYFGFGEHHAESVEKVDAGDDIRLPNDTRSDAPHPPATGDAAVTPNVPVATAPAMPPDARAPPENVAPASSKWGWNSPGLWAVIGIAVIGVLNLLGPKHTAGPALFAAGGMVGITLLIVVFALPQLDWKNLDLGRLMGHRPLELWEAFVAIVLALSGVEAIANLTGVMKKPVYVTARKSIWVVAIEVAVFNMLLAIIMCQVPEMGREAHKEDMLAYLARYYVGAGGEWAVRIVGGLLLLSATNTAIGALMGTVYVMSRDRELPQLLQKLNGFGTPWIAAAIATTVPIGVLMFTDDLVMLAQLYAIGIVGAVALNCGLTAFHPRLRRWYRRAPMLGIAIMLAFVWVTLAITKPHALIFVTLVMVVGLIARQLTRKLSARRPKQSLLRQAIAHQLTPEAMTRPKLLLATAGSDTMAAAALQVARAENATLMVCFIREVALAYTIEASTKLTLDTDPAAQALFTDFLEHGHQWEVPIIPIYDTGPQSAELIAEQAAIFGASKVLIGSSRRGAIHQLIKGSFQRKLESLLPPEIPVQVLSVVDVAPPEPVVVDTEEESPKTA